MEAMSYGGHISLNPGHPVSLGDLRHFLAEHDDAPDDSEIIATVEIGSTGWDPGKGTNPRGRVTRLTVRPSRPDVTPALD